MGEYVNYLTIETNGAFRDIRNISNVYKHLYTDIDPKKTNYNTVSSPAVIESIEIHKDGLEIDLISTEFAPNSTIKEKISFTRIDGSKSAFLPILDVVVDYWKNEIYKNA